MTVYDNGLPVSPKKVDLGNVSGAVELDLAAGNVFFATLTGAASFTYTNQAFGSRFSLVLTGNFVPTFGANVKIFDDSPAYDGVRGNIIEFVCTDEAAPVFLAGIGTYAL